MKAARLGIVGVLFTAFRGTPEEAQSAGGWVLSAECLVHFDDRTRRDAGSNAQILAVSLELGDLGEVGRQRGVRDIIVGATSWPCVDGQASV